MEQEKLEWGKPGICPYCGVLTDHRWYPHPVSVMLPNHLASATGQDAAFLHDGDNDVYASTCVSEPCRRTAFWVQVTRLAEEDVDSTTGVHNRVQRETVKLMRYPDTRNRLPPDEGLSRRELDLYTEAAKIASISPRASAALLRVLLEAFLKRQYESEAKLVDLIKKAAEDDKLPISIKNGIQAVRLRGNASVHDPYGITNGEQAGDLPLLFQAIDDLVDELHMKPKRWKDIVTST